GENRPRFGGRLPIQVWPNRDGQGYVPERADGVVRTAGGADVCGFARTYVGTRIRFREPSPRRGSWRQQADQTIEHSSSLAGQPGGRFWTFLRQNANFPSIHRGSKIQQIDQNLTLTPMADRTRTSPLGQVA